MTQPLRICLVKNRTDSDTVVDCLESIQFLNQGGTFKFPEEYQPLRNHPAIAGLSKVIKVLRSMREVSTYRYMRIALPEEQRSLYIDDDGHFKFAGQLLEEAPDRSRIVTAGSQDGGIVQDVACCFKDIGCNFEGTPRALDRHLASSPSSHLSLMSALVLGQKSETERLETEISSQKGEMDEQRAESRKEIERQTAEISELQKKNLELNRKISEQEARILEQGTEISSLRSATPISTLEPSVYSIWKISNYANQLAEAKSGKCVNISSKPFFTSKNGYKVRTSSYLNGEGDGKNTQLSIFFQLLQGEFDSLLRWPFTRIVSFSLMDQAKNPDEASHITKSFVPDPTLKEFQRPQKDCLKFGYGFDLVSHETLGTRHYVMDDTIFIKIEIR